MPLTLIFPLLACVEYSVGGKQLGDTQASVDDDTASPDTGTSDTDTSDTSDTSDTGTPDTDSTDTGSVDTGETDVPSVDCDTVWLLEKRKVGYSTTYTAHAWTWDPALGDATAQGDLTCMADARSLTDTRDGNLIAFDGHAAYSVSVTDLACSALETYEDVSVEYSSGSFGNLDVKSLATASERPSEADRLFLSGTAGGNGGLWEDEGRGAPTLLGWSSTPQEIVGTAGGALYGFSADGAFSRWDIATGTLDTSWSTTFPTWSDTYAMVVIGADIYVFLGRTSTSDVNSDVYLLSEGDATPTWIGEVPLRVVGAALPSCADRARVGG